ncbi:hypothetical protein PsorP6_000642 [Peronosclerospora sorghi]|uniref:Uncharacterized protein n=1 Tax=Peronosclerospora sorghi TaxID=230839 RepID=A0ACC0WUC1_9STRA|nr:hypothetical protein PsorP6_000642 [Peronosclerospora sorghi]
MRSTPLSWKPHLVTASENFFVSELLLVKRSSEPAKTRRALLRACTAVTRPIWFPNSSPLYKFLGRDGFNGVGRVFASRSHEHVEIHKLLG